MQLPWRYIGLFALLVIDIVLIALALGHASGLPLPDDSRGSLRAEGSVTPSPKATVGQGPTPLTIPTPESTPESAPESAPDPTAAANAGAGTSAAPEAPFHYLAGQVMWRVEPGDCEASATSEVFVSTDDGKTWSEAGQVEGEAMRVLGISAEQAIIANGKPSDGTCRVTNAFTRDAQTWGGLPEGANGLGFYRSAADRSAVNTPEGRVKVCPESTVIELDVAGGNRVVVLCADGRVLTSANGGGDFEQIARQKGALALAASSDRIWLVTARSERCGDRLAVIEAESRETICSSLPPEGPIAVDESNGRLAILAGDSVETFDITTAS